MRPKIDSMASQRGDELAGKERAARGPGWPRSQEAKKGPGSHTSTGQEQRAEGKGRRKGQAGRTRNQL